MSRPLESAPATPEPAPAPERRDLRRTARVLLRPLAVYAASRAAVLVSLWLVTRLQPGQSMTELFKTWDGNLYLQIIEGGYPEFPDDRGIFAFFPLYPLTSRAAAALPGLGALEAGLLVGAVAGCAAAVLLWLLCRELLDERTADRAVALFAFFPGSFVLSMVYSEGLMIALAAGCLWALVRHQWLLAGVLAALATASRPNAIALIVACAWAAGMAVHARRDWRSLVAPALAPLGVLAYFGLLWVRTGDPLTWFTVQRELWEERVTPMALIDDLRVFVAAPFENTNTTAVVIGAAVSAVGLVMLVRSPLPSVLSVYAAVVIAMAACSETLGTRPRFVLTAFPIFFAFALRLQGVAFSAVLGLSATLLGGFTMISVATLLFTP
ncbi:glycosyltransferase family 39 protein [Candidatus Blastococcus massiliensis]|uniref:glycosyltransferase family 39 protein n=1 Tax=Candidatus Blastococcus massiliensis TaxID=1470358 RepID=UPI0004B11E58|nr:glycosyltransferase family 39 protein [Candidatus Blastococcus massiliensis]